MIKILQVLKASLPLIILVLLFAIFRSPVKINGFNSLEPQFSIIFIFYSAIYYPRMFSITSLVAVGILQDILSNDYLGFNAITNVISYSVINNQQKIFIKEPFAVVWLGFGVFSLLVACIQWLFVTVFISHNFFFSIDLVFQWLSTACIYPLIHILITKLRALEYNSI